MLLALKSHNVFGAFLSMSVFGYVAANYTLAVGVVCGSQRFPAPYKRLIGGIKKTNHERTTGRLPV